MEGDTGRASRSLSRRLLTTAACLGGLAISAQGERASAADPQNTAASSVPEVGELIVTATRRTESLEKVPFNISAYNGKDLERANVTTVATLSQEVPNFVMEDQGARSSASSIPIIRGLNASEPANGGLRFFQSPVGFYLGNAPMTELLPIEDVQRIEVLRGPQGTLYGAGALAGAVRIVPNEPELGRYDGLVSGAVEGVGHSSQVDYDAYAVVNLPVGDTAALRIVAQKEFDAGFIDQHDIMRRQGNDYVSGAPLLANPMNVASSPAIYFNQNDTDYATTNSARGIFLWEPTDRFKLNLSYSYAYVFGEGEPVDNPTFAGGPSPIDPRITLAPTGDYQISDTMLEPFNRTTQLASADLSYDLGFATLSSTVAYGHTHGYIVGNSTDAILGTPYAYYYVGSPANPRAVIPVTFPDRESTWTEEVRLVSNEGQHRFDYVVGAFFEQNNRYLGEYLYNPGAPAQSAAAHGGSMLPILFGGTYIPTFANALSYSQAGYQTFDDYSLYGDLTFHINDRWQITGGVRGFHETFSQRLVEASKLFFFTIDQTNSTALTSQIFEVNTSYRLNNSAQLYATWSQGFRRGGANAFALAGAVLEPKSLLFYKPDETNNYEAGVKGVVEGVYYAADLFYVDWIDPQIDTRTPYNLTSVVINAKAAASKGVEAEFSGPIGPKGLSFIVGFAYSPARLTENFTLPAGNGAGGIVPNAIIGNAGARLPGAPDFSASATVNYEMSVGDGKLIYSLGYDYRSSIWDEMPSSSPNLVESPSPGYGLLRGSIVYDLHKWEVELFGTNLTDARALITTPTRSLTSIALLGTWGNAYAIVRPLEVGLRLTRHF